MPENAEQNNSELSFQFVWVSKMLVESVYNPGVMGGNVCLINLLPNFSFEKSWTILAHLNKNPSVFIHNTIDFGKKLFFRVFCVCFGIEFQTLHVLELTIKPYMFCNWLSKKWLRSTFPSYTSRNHYLFWLFIGVMEKETILNIMFIFKSIDTTVLTVLPYSFFDWTTFPKSTCQGSGSFSSSFFRTWTYLYHSFTVVFFDLSWRHVAIRIIFLLTD